MDFSLSPLDVRSRTVNLWALYLVQFSLRAPRSIPTYLGLCEGKGDLVGVCLEAGLNDNTMNVLDG